MDKNAFYTQLGSFQVHVGNLVDELSGFVNNFEEFSDLAAESIRTGSGHKNDYDLQRLYDLGRGNIKRIIQAERGIVASANNFPVA